LWFAIVDDQHSFALEQANHIDLRIGQRSQRE
jgi:hypothetical protein